jgi:Multicopper oxidase
MSEEGMSALRQSADYGDDDRKFNSDLELEQTEALLSSDIPKGYPQNGWWKHFRARNSVSKSQGIRLKLLFAALAVTIVGLLVFSIATTNLCGIFNSTHCVGPGQHKQADFRRPQTDYLLDPKWKFDSKPTKRHYRFVISDIEVNPDGVYRPMILINGQFPGPLIECNDGDRLVIEVENQSMNATAFHWHGLYQNGSNWMDGTVGVTQCPIAPGGNFTYDFTVSGQHGTYWWVQSKFFQTWRSIHLLARWVPVYCCYLSATDNSIGTTLTWDSKLRTDLLDL